jgi:hypothetical protein
MKYAVMSLASYRLLDWNDQKPIVFETYDEAEMFIRIYALENVAIVQLGKEIICVKADTALKSKKTYCLNFIEKLKRGRSR